MFVFSITARLPLAMLSVDRIGEIAALLEAGHRMPLPLDLELEVTNLASKAIPSQTIQARTRITLVPVYKNFDRRSVVITVAGRQFVREDRCL